MYRGVIVADAARCRFFSMGTVENDDFEIVPTFTEHEDLANPQAALPGQELYSNTKSGRNQAAGGGPAHGYDDHRARHRDEELRRFARRIVTDARRFVRERQLAALVLIAEPRLLGVMREELDAQLKELVIAEIAEDVTKHDRARLRRLLEQRELLPKTLASGAYRPRGQPG